MPTSFSEASLAAAPEMGQQYLQTNQTFSFLNTKNLEAPSSVQQKSGELGRYRKAPRHEVPTTRVQKG